MTTKRVFTSPEKWDKSWYRKLPPKLKCLWAYITERCDQAGVWEGDFELASFYIGDTVTEKDLSAFEGRIIPFKGKYRIIGYIHFQQNLSNSEGGELNPKRLAHIPIIKLVNAHGFAPEMGEDEAEAEALKKKEPLMPFLIPKPAMAKKAPKELTLIKEDIFNEIFGNERYMESIQKIAEGKNIQEAFEECWTYHSLQPNPPTQAWIWKQKFLTWVTNKKPNTNATLKTKQHTRTKSLIDSFNERVGESAEE